MHRLFTEKENDKIPSSSGQNEQKAAALDLSDADRIIQLPFQKEKIEAEKAEIKRKKLATSAKQSFAEQSKLEQAQQKKGALQRQEGVASWTSYGGPRIPKKLKQRGK